MTETPVPEGTIAPTVTFADLGLAPDLLRAVIDSGYTTPTPIQAEAIPHALAGKDVLGLAQTGTGKTASFTLPMIQRLSQGRAKARMPRSLVITPTRELADQVAQSFEKYAKYYKLSWALLIGGVSFGDQEAKLDRGVDVLIATPGRLLDHFERGKLLMNGVQILVVDEADRMLDMGFIPDIERIFKMTPFTRQTLFFSATMPPEIKSLTDRFLQNPVTVAVALQSTTAETISQYAIQMDSNDAKQKRTILRALMQRVEIKNAIVFCNRKTDVDIVAKSLSVHGLDAAPIHGDLPQSVRTATLEKFRSGTLKILVASDVAARGLDIPDVGQVFNYDVPRHAEDYVHRIGRTGRAGRSGEAYTIVSAADTKSLAAVEDLIKKPVEMLTLDIELPAPEAKRDRQARDGDRSKRGGSRSGPRRDGAPRPTEPRAPRAQKPAAQPKPAVEMAERAAPVESRPARNTRSERPAPREREHGDRAVVGFGDDLPGFLRPR
jgi:superfamily II DNA/RNA helicase